MKSSTLLWDCTVQQFVLMYGNARSYTDVIADVCLECEGFVRMEWPTYSFDLIKIQRVHRPLHSAVLECSHDYCVQHFPPHTHSHKVANCYTWKLVITWLCVWFDLLTESMVTYCKPCMQVRYTHTLLMSYLFLCFCLSIILWRIPILFPLVSYKNSILFSSLNVILYFVPSISILATVLQHFALVKAVLVDFPTFYCSILKFCQWV